MRMQNYDCFKKGVKFNNYISLGYYCGIAMELERLGLRNVSLPFDWLITADFESVLRLIDTNFQGFLDYDSLGQEYMINPKYYYDDILSIHYYHDFNGYQSLDEQLENVKEKYRRRIDRFYQKLKEPSLLFRYIENKAELSYLVEHHAEIEERFKYFNSDNRVLFLIDSKITSNQELTINGGGTLSYKMIQMNEYQGLLKLSRN